MSIRPDNVKSSAMTARSEPDGGIASSGNAAVGTSADSAEACAAQPTATFWWLVGGLGVLLIVGFAGLDRWFYEHVSRSFNTDDGVTIDWYQRTEMFWLAVRYGCAHVCGVALAYFAILTCCGEGGFRRANALLLSVLTVALAAHVAQAGICRLRPNQADSHLAFAPPFSSTWAAHNVGFPSGEVATGAALAITLSMVFPRWRALFFGMGVLVFITRVLPGNHYLSDGAASGLLALMITPPLYGWLLKEFSRNLGTRRKPAQIEELQGTDT